MFEESGEFLEYFENGIEVVSYLTYHGSTPFSDELWSLFDQMIRAFHGFACDSVWKSTSVSGANRLATPSRTGIAVHGQWRNGKILISTQVRLHRGARAVSRQLRVEGHGEVSGIVGWNR